MSSCIRNKVIVLSTTFIFSNNLDIFLIYSCINPSARFLADENVSRLYVAYKFLDEVYDTPYSLPKPKAKENIVFNFRKDHFKKKCS